jgi:uncharacterized protein YecE (DUF72 family)
MAEGVRSSGNPVPRTKAWIGCAGWSIPRHEAPRFPPQGSHLERYSQIFNACEINSSFYRSHKIATWERWANSVPAEFRFAVKAPKTITHEERLDCDSQLLPAFLREISALNSKLGPVLFQLPPSLACEAARAKRFFGRLRELYCGNVVLEPRHSTWFNERVEDLLNEFEIARVASDPACVDAAAEPGGYPSLVYFRLHGSPRRYYSAYSEQYLEALKAKIISLKVHAQVWCVFDNTAAGFAIGNAAYLRASMESENKTG